MLMVGGDKLLVLVAGEKFQGGVVLLEDAWVILAESWLCNGYGLWVDPFYVVVFFCLCNCGFIL